MRQDESLKAGLIRRITVTLDYETRAWFKSRTAEDGETGGTRWLELVAHTPRDHASANADQELPTTPAGDCSLRERPLGKCPWGRVDGPERAWRGREVEFPVLS